MNALDAACDEARFAAYVDACRADPARHADLVDLLREEHAVYAGRGTAATMRMRGWALAAAARAPLGDDVLVHVLEPLDNGLEAYLVAVAARALRVAGTPHPAYAPLVVKALATVRHRDDRVDLERYGAYAIGTAGTTAVRELLATLEWMGPALRGVAGELRTLAGEDGGSRESRTTLARLAASASAAPDDDACCRLPWPFASQHRDAAARVAAADVDDVVFEDQDGRAVAFGAFFRGKPTVVSFFYTRCDNPYKCSLTVAQLAAVRRELDARGVAGRVRVAAVTYDPGFDDPARIKSYGEARGIAFDDDTRLLRVPSGMDALRAHFGLGVNFVESLVNRHRIEVYVLDAQGRVAATFSRLRWDPVDVASAAQGVLTEPARAAPAGLALVGGAASVLAAFFPKCPMCWAAYLSLFGVASVERLPYSPWLQPLFVGLMLVNLASLWLRARTTGSLLGFGVAAAGALVVGGLVAGLGWREAAPLGVALTVIGSLLGVARLPRRARG